MAAPALQRLCNEARARARSGAVPSCRSSRCLTTGML